MMSFWVKIAINDVNVSKYEYSTTQAFFSLHGAQSIHLQPHLLEEEEARVGEIPQLSTYGLFITSLVVHTLNPS